MFYTQESARHIPALETKLTANPSSPVFARLASFYLTEGKAEQAIQICVQGLKKFPEYATGHLILGRAYEAVGRNVEAMLEYRKVLRALPDNPIVNELLRKVEQREQEAFRAFSEERARQLQERRNQLSLDQYLAEETKPAEGTVEFLLDRLRAAAVSPSPEDHQKEKEESPEPAAAPRIVTATLAEIYASQGEYREAIAAYRKLLEQHPSEVERFEKRIAQLEEMSRLQHAESKN